MDSFIGIQRPTEMLFHDFAVVIFPTVGSFDMQIAPACRARCAQWCTVAVWRVQRDTVLLTVAMHLAKPVAAFGAPLAFIDAARVAAMSLVEWYACAVAAIMEVAIARATVGAVTAGDRAESVCRSRPIDDAPRARMLWCIQRDADALTGIVHGAKTARLHLPTAIFNSAFHMAIFSKAMCVVNRNRH